MRGGFTLQHSTARPIPEGLIIACDLFPPLLCEKYKGVSFDGGSNRCQNGELLLLLWARNLNLLISCEKAADNSARTSATSRKSRTHHPQLFLDPTPNTPLRWHSITVTVISGGLSRMGVSLRAREQNSCTYTGCRRGDGRRSNRKG